MESLKEGHQRRMEKYRKQYEQRRKFYRLLKENASDILHSDYFLYDWHDKNRENYQKLHGFYHPGIALKNARKEYHLTRREEDIIKKHMWPLTVVPPLCREAWVVTAADKYCSLLETLKIRKRPGRVRVGVAK